MQGNVGWCPYKTPLTSASMLLGEWLSSGRPLDTTDGADMSDRHVSIPLMGFNVNVAYGVMSPSSPSSSSSSIPEKGREKFKKI
jgi:hypothetical protein